MFEQGDLGLAPAAYSGKDLKKFTIANAWEYSLSNEVSKAPRSTGIKELIAGGNVSNIDSNDRRRL